MIGTETQLEINFEAGLTDRYQTWWDCVVAAVHASGNQKGLAADMDMSPSEFSRRLSVNGDLPFHAEHMQRLMELLQKRGDLSCIYWLVEKFLRDSDTAAETRRVKLLLGQLERIIPELLEYKHKGSL